MAFVVVVVVVVVSVSVGCMSLSVTHTDSHMHTIQHYSCKHTFSLFFLFSPLALVVPAVVPVVVHAWCPLCVSASLASFSLSLSLSPLNCHLAPHI
jgi:hypothetical protein